MSKGTGLIDTEHSVSILENTSDFVPNLAGGYVELLGALGPGMLPSWAVQNSCRCIKESRYGLVLCALR
jgi:hypothetical protein